MASGAILVANKFMVKGDFLPSGGGVAVGTVVAIAAIVGLVVGMTSQTVAAGAFVIPLGVATGAIGDGMSPF